VNPVLQYLLAITPAIPMLAVAVIGIILGIYRRKSQPIASRLVISGLIALSANVLGSIAVRVYNYTSFDKYQDATVHAQHLVQLNVVLYVLNIAGVALITAAAFANRAPRHEARLTDGSRVAGPRLR
jgi:hypothetical protein